MLLKGHLDVPSHTVQNANGNLVVTSVGQVLQLRQCLPLMGIELAHKVQSNFEEKSTSNRANV